MSKQLTTKTKLFYGLGFSAQGIKDGLFQLFLFFYFTQVLGLDPALTGISTLIALAFDAISDPLVGSWSDRWKSDKWGRRHPFMLASAVPFGLAIYFLFVPPEGLDQIGLFWWLTVFTILIRVSMTFFNVPAMSLGAELSDDYEERTSITTYRVTFSAFIAPFIIIFGLLTFFTPKEGMSNGLLNEEAYPKFAFLCSILIVLAILISSWGTKNTIPNLPKAFDTKRNTIGQIFKGFGNALQLKSYRSLVGYIMMIYIGVGVGTTFTTYFTTYFFELSEKELAVLPVATALSGLGSFVLGPWMGRKLDKKATSILCTFLFALFFGAPFYLRLLGVFPENDSVALLPLYFLFTFLGYLFLWVVMSLTSSMMADVVDESELNTGIREEGIFFSTMSFAYKMTVGVGYLISGILLKIIAFPGQVDVAEVPNDAINGLGWIGGIFMTGLYLLSILFVLNYPINKARFEEIRSQLD